MNASRKKIAVFFGGRSPEHDVSVVTGLQILHAIDQSRYEAFPVYITPEGGWLTGDILRKRENYLLSAEGLAQTQSVTLDVTPGRRARLVPLKKAGLFKKVENIEFDAAIPSFHGLYGEDGNIQGLFEFAGVPYAGMRTLASSVLMDKGATKILHSAGIPMLPYAIIKRPAQGYMIAAEDLKAMMGPVSFPCIVKPSHLGSSIGVAKAGDLETLRAALPVIFEYDDAAIIEPFVENLVEYNVAVSKAFGEVRTSAIERPKTTDELLDFKQKYCSGGNDKSGNKLGSKTEGPVSEGMLSLTRELNPDIPADMQDKIRKWAMEMFAAVDGTGAPRIDFIGNSKTGELWLNEVNPWPGSIGYFLWEAAKDHPALFTDLLTALIEEAFTENRARALPKDPVPKDARLLKRRG